MKSPYRALIWEQARTGGAICLLLAALSCLSVSILHLLHSIGQVSAADAGGVSIIVLGYSVLGVALLVLRQDMRGQLTGGFEPRWFRLPVSLPILFGIVLISRYAFVALLTAVQTLLLLTLPRVPLEDILFVAFFPVYVYTFLQAASWSCKRAPVFLFSLILLPFAVGLGFRSVGLAPELITGIFTQTIWTARTLLLIPPLMTLITVYGVYLERQDRYFGPKGPGMLINLVSRILVPPLKKPQTSFDAQVWYEMRRVTWMLPFFTVAFSFLFLFLMILVMNHPLSSGFGQYVPLVALVVSGFVAGAGGTFPRSTMQTLRPTNDRSIAAARLAAQLRALLIAMLLAGVLSLVLLLAGPLERSVLIEWRGDGLILLFDIFVVITRPLILAAMLAWVLLWVFTVPMGVMVYTTITFLSLSGFFGNLYFEEGGILYPAHAYAFMTITATLFVATLIDVHWKGLIGRNHLLVILALGLVLASFLWLGSRTLVGFRGLLLACAVGMLLVFPVTSLIWTVQEQRHEPGFRRPRK